MTKLVDWGEDLETGWSFMDEGHRRFVELLNRLHRASRDGTGNDAVSSTVSELATVMNAHLDKEETAMLQSRYPLFSDHKMQHDYMRLKLKELERDIGAGTQITAAELIDHLMNWLAQHTRRHDRDLARHLAKRVSVGR